jgi:hypothetical protein
MAGVLELSMKTPISVRAWYRYGSGWSSRVYRNGVVFGSCLDSDYPMFWDIGLTPNTSYSFYARGYSSWGCGLPVMETTPTVYYTTPNIAPTNFTATPSGCTGAIKFNWTNYAGYTGTLKLQKLIGATWTNVVTGLTNTTTTYTVTGQSMYVSFSWRVVNTYSFYGDFASSTVIPNMYQTSVPVLNNPVYLSGSIPVLGFSANTTTIPPCTPDYVNWYFKLSTDSAYTVYQQDYPTGKTFTHYGIKPNTNYTVAAAWATTGATASTSTTKTVNYPLSITGETYTSVWSGCSIYNKATIVEPALPYADYYILYRSTTSGGIYTQVASGNSYTLYDTTPVYGTTYWYKVTAVNSGWTVTSTAKSLQSILTLNNPIALDVSLSGGTYILDWIDTNNPIAGNYEVYRLGENTFPTTGLTNYWKFDSTTGSVVEDSLGGINGIMSNGIWTTGKHNNCIEFLGADAKNTTGTTVDMGAGTCQFERNEPFTFSLWFKHAYGNVQTFNPLISNAYSGRTNGFCAYLLGGGLIYLSLAGNSTTTSAISKSYLGSTQDTNWHLFTVTYDGSSTAAGLKMYLDGGEVTLNTHRDNLNTTTKSPTAKFFVGKMLITPYNDGDGWNSGTTFFRGKIDEVAVYNRAITSNEVLSIYNTSTYNEWELIDIVTGDTYVDTGATVGFDYAWRVRGFSDCFEPTIIYTPYSESSDILLPQVNTNEVINIEKESATVVSNVISSGTSELITRGICYNTTGTPTTGDTIISTTGQLGLYSLDITGLSQNTLYYVRAYAANQYGVSYGNQLMFYTTYDILPVSDVVVTDITCTGATISWVNNNISGVTGIYIKRYIGFEYVTIATLSSGATTYDLTGLTPNINPDSYENVLIVTFSPHEELNSPVIQFKTLNPAPFNLSGVTNYNNITFTWEINDSAFGTAIIPQYRIVGDLLWLSGDTLSKNDTEYRFTNLSYGTTYEARFVRLGSEYPSTAYTFTIIDLVYQPAFCTGTYYDVVNSTCGSNNGTIEIPILFYFEFYNFTVTDSFDNSYNFDTTTGYLTGLTSGWYNITATPKPAYWGYYGNSSCSINWINLEDSDTTISLVSTKLKHAVCGGFGESNGRIILQLTDSGTTTGWTYNLWTNSGVLVDEQILTGSTFTGITNIISNVGSDIYFGILKNNNGCSYLIDLIKVQSVQLWTVDKIQRLFITPWDSNLSYNYFSSEDEDWYVTGVDTLQFTSSKIKEYISLPDYWYEIRLDTATMDYSETFQKNQNGLTYNEQVTINIPRAENSKWKQLTDILNKRYVIVFQDNHDNWWTCFYRHGAEVKSYSLSQNQYVISFIHPSVNKMLTAIDYNYVKLHIL